MGQVIAKESDDPCFRHLHTTSKSLFSCVIAAVVVVTAHRYADLACAAAALIRGLYDGNDRGQGERQREERGEDVCVCVCVCEREREREKESERDTNK